MIEPLLLVNAAGGGLPVPWPVIIGAIIALAVLMVIGSLLLFRSSDKKKGAKTSDWQPQGAAPGAWNQQGAAGGWGQQQQQQQSGAGWGSPNMAQPSAPGGWGAQAGPQQAPNSPWGSAEATQQSSNPWGGANPAQQQAANPWGASPAQQQQQSSNPWGASPAQQQQAANPWGASPAPQPANSWGGGDANATQQAGGQWGGQAAQSPWGEPAAAAAPAKDQWGQPQSQPSQDQWGQQQDPWAQQKQDPWAQQQQQQPQSQDPWAQQQQQQPMQSQDPWAQQQAAAGQSWGAQGQGGMSPQQAGFGNSGSGASWGQPQQQPQASADPWGAPAAQQQYQAPAANNASALPSWQQSGFGPTPSAAGDSEKTVLRSGTTGPTGAPQGLGIVRVEEGKEPGRIYEIRKDSLSIGRSRESDIFLEDLAVSRLHASIVNLGNGNYALKDEGSANGTKVNGQLVNKYQTFPLQEGDRVQLGQTVLVFGRR